MNLGWLIRLGLSISENIRAQQEIERAHALEAQARSEALAQSQRAKAETASYKRTAYEQKIARESVAVECPNCGSMNTRIRLGSAANCAYCGTAIRVSIVLISIVLLRCFINIPLFGYKFSNYFEIIAIFAKKFNNVTLFIFYK